MRTVRARDINPQTFAIDDPRRCRRVRVARLGRVLGQVRNGSLELLTDLLLTHPSPSSKSPWPAAASRGGYGIERIIPPSTGTIAPVTYEAAGESRNAATRP